METILLDFQEIYFFFNEKRHMLKQSKVINQINFLGKCFASPLIVPTVKLAAVKFFEKKIKEALSQKKNMMLMVPLLSCVSMVDNILKLPEDQIPLAIDHELIGVFKSIVFLS